MGIVRLTGQLICADTDDVALVAMHVPTHIALTLAEPGCLTFSVVQTVDPMIWQVDDLFLIKPHSTRIKPAPKRPLGLASQPISSVRLQSPDIMMLPAGSRRHQ